MYDLAGQTAVVTGGARGLGRVFAAELAQAGVRVAVADRDLPGAEAVAAAIVAAGGEAIAVEVELLDPVSVQAMGSTVQDAFGAVRILVNHGTAGELPGDAAPHAGGLAELGIDEWRRAIDINVTSILLSTRALLEPLRRAGGARIVNRSSSVADQPHDAFSIGNLGAQGVTVSLARSLARYDITVNCIVPGPTIAAAAADPEPRAADPESRASVPEGQLLARAGSPQDLAAALLWLVSDQASFVTGQLIRVDGGYVVHPG